MGDAIDTNAKALRINLDRSCYGTFAEIGGGQEVSRWFFRVGGAAGTVAKTICAYDMTVSDAIYGHADRYVSRSRILSMLDHEHTLLVERLAEARGKDTRFFSFANSVATRSYKGDNEAHGWVGLRFQHTVGAVPSQVILHVALQEPSASMQQQSLGVLGVNLLHAAFYQRASRAEFVRSLRDDLPPDAVHVDVAHCEGPAFEWGVGALEVARELLSQRLTPAVIFNVRGEPDQPSSIVRKRSLLIYRAVPGSHNPELDAMLSSSASLLAAEEPDFEPLPVIECSCRAVSSPDAADKAIDVPGFEGLIGPGHATLLTTLPENHRVATYLRSLAPVPMRYIVGLDHLIAILRDRFYESLDGGILEGLGRLLPARTRIYVYAMPARTLRDRLERRGIDGSFCTFPDAPLVRVEDVTVAPPSGHLLAFLRDAGWIASVLPTSR